MRTALLTGTLALAACAASDPGTRAGIDPAMADPAALRFAIALPENVRVRDGTAAMILTALRTDTGETSEARYNLIQTVSGEWDVFTIAPRDRILLSAQQEEIADWRAAAPDATMGTLSFNLTACADGPVPEDAEISIAATGRPGAPLTPLVEDAPLETVTDGTAIGPCDGRPTSPV